MPLAAAQTWRSTRHRSGQRRLAAEAEGSYESRAATAADRQVRFTGAVDALVATPIDELGEAAIRAELGAIEEGRRRLDARACRLAAALTERQRRRAREARPNDPHAGRRAERQTRRELQDRLRWTSSQAKRAQELGRDFTHSPEAGRAFDDGGLPPSHAKLLADTLRWLEGDTHDRAEAELLAAAQRENAAAFGRTCRRLLAELDHDAAMRAERRRHGRRRASLVQTEDGMTRLSAEVAGIDGEYVATAVHAFRRVDAEGERRTAEQATADAVVAMARAALDAGTASRQHGARPHVIVLSDREQVRRERQGAVETAFSGPLPAGEALHLLDDAEVSQLLCDTRGIPVEASEKVRTVPVGVYRGVFARDGGRCIGDGCDVPSGWCQMMHLDVPYRLEGRLTIDTAGLGCGFHHQKLDHDGWVVTWVDGRPILHHPDRPPGDRTPRDAEERPPDPPDGETSRQRPSEAIDVTEATSHCPARTEGEVPSSGRPGRRSGSAVGRASACPSDRAQLDLLRGPPEA
jgi:hypothetical protein